MGMSVSMMNWLAQSFPPKPKWSAEDMPDLTGKVALVTGGNAGIGREMVKELLKKNAKVYIASRSEERCRTAIDSLKAETGKEALFFKLDQRDLASVKASAEELLSKENQLDILINNAGVVVAKIPEAMTVQGYDLAFGTNALGQFYFTKLLLPLLLATAEKGADVRIVGISSVAHSYVSGLDYETFRESEKRRKMDPTLLYGQSKFGATTVSTELARRYGDKGITSVSSHPGNIRTDMTSTDLPWFAATIMKPLVYDVSYGALTGLYAATAPEVKEHNGGYFIPWARLGNAQPNTRDPEVGAKLWKWLEEQITAFEEKA